MLFENNRVALTLVYKIWPCSRTSADLLLLFSGIQSRSTTGSDLALDVLPSRCIESASEVGSENLSSYVPIAFVGARGFSCVFRPSIVVRYLASP